MTLTDLKFTEEELAAKSVIALDDRPQLSAAQMKAKLDSGDIRERFNQTMDILQQDRRRLFVFDSLNEEALSEVKAANPDGTRFFAILLDRKETFFGNAEELEERM
ncbi:MAG: hypothetical protein IJN80_03595 [Clostridia bacterium]|nr:hypothetical protein [Clostridia bacterium]